VVSEKTSRLGRQLKEVTNEGSTGVMAKVEGFEVAGKTGTAQKADLTHGGYAAKRVGSFVGFVPADAPKLVALVLVDEPEVNVYGGVVAAPVFRNIARGALRHLAVAPQKPDLVPRGWPSRTSCPASLKKKEVADGNAAAVPDFVGLSLREAVEKARAMRSRSKCAETAVVRQSPAPEVAGARKHFGFKPPRLAKCVCGSFGARRR
jgi:cell division protein FtsI (penicillin-binding protein 3)